MYYSKKEKFEGQSEEGIIYEYAQVRGFRVMNLQEYVQSRGNVVVTTTRHLKIHVREFPLWDIHKEFIYHDSWHLRMRVPPKTGDVDWRTDYMGRVKCARCNKFLSDDPIYCKACLENPAHGRGRPPFGCRRSRCQGHVIEVEDEAGTSSQVNIEYQGAQDPPSPRWRVLRKSPRGERLISPRDRDRSPRVSVPITSGGEAGAESASNQAEHDAPEATADEAMPSALEEIASGPPQLGAAKKFRKSASAVPKGERNPEPAYIEDRNSDEILADAQAAGKEFTETFETDHERDVKALTQDITHVMGLVTRVVDINSREGRTNRGALRAMEMEVNNIKEKEAIVIESLMEREEAKKKYPDAEFVDCRMLLARRHAEVAAVSEEEEDRKARLIVQGCGQRDVYDNLVVEDVVQQIPAGMTEQRLGHAHQSFFDDGIGLLGDVDGAYLTTLLGGALKFLTIISLLCPLFDSKIRSMKDPVALARKASYGFKRAGGDFSEKARRSHVRNLGYRQIRDIAMSVFLRWPILLIVYSDDMNPNGPKKECYYAYEELDRVFHFSKKNRCPVLTEFTGLRRQALGKDPLGTTWYRLHQTPYATMVVENYVQYKKVTALKPGRFRCSRPRRRSQTPMRLEMNSPSRGSSSGVFSSSSGERGRICIRPW